MTVVVLGASGATGRHVVSTALERGHEVVALVRRPGTFAPQDRLIEVTWPDVADASTLASALPGADVVISALGGAGQGPTTVCTDGIRSAVAAMKAAGVTRLIAVSSRRNQSLVGTVGSAKNGIGTVAIASMRRSSARGQCR